jgi:uncharacterized membrane protein YkoI
MASFLKVALEPILKGLFIRRSAAGADNLGNEPPPGRSEGGSHRSAQHGGFPLNSPRTTIALALTLLLGLCAPVAARDGAKDDHERARAAVQAGEILPLPVLLERLQRTYPGQVLELELEREDGRWIYEVRLLQPNGQLLRLELDARTAQVLEGRRRHEGYAGPAREPAR